MLSPKTRAELAEFEAQVTGTALGLAVTEKCVQGNTGLFDIFVMYVDGVEREEQQWRSIFLEAGFSDYKITPIHGFQSLIE
ncbi:hypothetical protein EJB05_23076, partial [Eragrostis curvula]